MAKYINIYIWQAISILFNFASVFVVTPFISSQPNLYGIYSIIIAAYLFISYADFGFLSAGIKYASECFAQNNQEDEIEVLGFAGFIFLIFALIYALGIFAISFNPSILVKGISNSIEIEVARKMLLILSFSCPVLVFQRIIQIIFGIRLQDFIFQRILILSNFIKLISSFYFFSNGRYLIVEYFFFSQICTFFAVILGFYYIKKNINYNLSKFFKAFHYSRRMFLKTNKLAFTSIFLTICWILYYELDTFAIAKIFGAKSVAIYAIGLTIITYFRTLFGIIFTPFIARFNHFVGLKDKAGLQIFFFKVIIIFLPLTVFPVITIFFTVNNFILCWVGQGYITSIPIAQVLILTYIFSFITYPSGILIMANERVKALYYTSALQPIIFWIGVFATKKYLGLESFAYFKFIALFIETVVYTFIIIKFLEINFGLFLKKVVVPAVAPFTLIIVTIFLFRGFLPIEMGKVHLLFYFLSVTIVIFLGIIIYYFTSSVFKMYSKKLIDTYLYKLKPVNIDMKS